MAGALYTAWISGGIYLVIGSILALWRWLKRSADPLAVVAATFFSTCGVVVVVVLVFCSVDRFANQLR